MLSENKDDFEMKIACQFAAFCKKVLQYTAIDCYNEQSRQRKREILFSALSQEEMTEVYRISQYSEIRDYFTVGKFQVGVEDDFLVDAIAQLSELKRGIILLYYFLGFRNRDIAEIYGLTETTISRYKCRALRQMKIILQKERR